MERCEIFTHKYIKTNIWSWAFHQLQSNVLFESPCSREGNLFSFLCTLILFKLNYRTINFIKAQKLHPVVKFLVLPVIFETTAGALRHDHLFDLHVIVFIKNARITTSVPNILSFNQWSLYHLKESQMDNLIYISQLSTSFFFYKLLLEVEKLDVRLWN